MNELLQHKIKTISKMSTRLNSLVWWASPISSRNRFYQPFNDVFESIEINYLKLIPTYLYKFTRIIFSTLAKCLYAKFKRLNLNFSKTSKDILIIKSFLYSNQNMDTYVDSFFGDLPNYLPDNFEVIYLLEPVNCHKLALSKSNQNIVSIFKIINPTDILWIVYHLITNFFRVYKETFDNDLERRIFHIHLLDHINPTTFFAMLYYSIGLRLGKWPHVRTLLYTFENNPWEKMLLAGINKSAQHIKTIGYQHNVIPLASSNMFFGYEELSLSPKPDKILTTGPKTKEIIQQFSSFPKDRIISTCALRYEYLHQISPNPRLKSKKVLVALEGVWQAASFVNYILKEIESLQEWDITLRCHPALPIEQLRKKFSMPLENFKNIHVSNNISLTEEIKNNFCILYWGSTVALEAIMLGRPVINISFTEVNFDPLFELSFFKRTWIVNDSLSTKLSELYNLADIQYEEEASRACSYIKDYFYPCTPENLQNFKSDFIYFNN